MKSLFSVTKLDLLNSYDNNKKINKNSIKINKMMTVHSYSNLREAFGAFRRRLSSAAIPFDWVAAKKVPVILNTVAVAAAGDMMERNIRVFFRCTHCVYAENVKGHVGGYTRLYIEIV